MLWPTHWREFVERNHLEGIEIEIPEADDLSGFRANIWILSEDDAEYESNELYPGIAVKSAGFVCVGGCGRGMGDPYFININVGAYTTDFHDFYNQYGQIAFKVVNGKYEFAGDFNFFAFESGAIYKAFPNREDEIRADYLVRFESYEQSRLGFLKYGCIPYNADTPYDPDVRACITRGPLVSQLGGEPVLINWHGPIFPVNRNGKPFRYIGEVQGFSYCQDGIQAILLFYDPEEQIAVFRYEWT